jgi:hypothetical protein
MTPRPFPALVLLAALLAPGGGCTDDSSAPDGADLVEIDVVSASAIEAGMPSFSEHAGVLLLSHLERRTDSTWALRVTEFAPAGEIVSARDVTQRGDFFVNWADFPSVTPVGPAGERWVAHWLQRGPEGGYDYGVRLAESHDRGGSWSEAWTPHEDATPTEHGFVSVIPGDDGYGVLWLDGRRFAEGVSRMQLRSRRGGAEGGAGPERVVDELVCDCCQTDMASTPSGAIAVYRNRTEDEIRDIHAARWDRAADEWVELGPVHDDGWEIGGCPVNGPAVASNGTATAVAWFTAAGDRPVVQVATGGADGGDFGVPVRVDLGAPVGRVDVRFGPDGDPRVLWMESRPDGRAELLLVRVRADGSVDEPARVAELDAARGTGFPRFSFLADGDALVAWTDLDGDARRLRAVRIAAP